jgi:hypothetical protein
MTQVNYIPKIGGCKQRKAKQAKGKATRASELRERKRQRKTTLGNTCGARLSITSILTDLFTERRGMNNFIILVLLASLSSHTLSAMLPVVVVVGVCRKKRERTRRAKKEPLITSCSYDSFHFTFFLLLSLFAVVTEAFIVPQELPSILSLVYSNIPPIKKGNYWQRSCSHS